MQLTSRSKAAAANSLGVLFPNTECGRAILVVAPYSRFATNLIQGFGVQRIQKFSSNAANERFAIYIVYRFRGSLEVQDDFVPKRPHYFKRLSVSLGAI